MTSTMTWHIESKCRIYVSVNYIDSEVYGANMGPTWGRQDPGGPHVGHMNFVTWVYATNGSDNALSPNRPTAIIKRNSKLSTV